MALKEIDWFPLDPAKADYGAVFGAYVAGCTLLELESGIVTVTGVCSCTTRTDAERIARKNSGPQDKDKFISRKTLLSWAK